MERLRVFLVTADAGDDDEVSVLRGGLDGEHANEKERGKKSSLESQMTAMEEKVGEYLKLLTRPQVETMVKKQAEVIEKYKELLG